MTVIINGTGGVTYPDSTTQASANISAANITSGTLASGRLPDGTVLQVVQTVLSNTSVYFTTASTSLVATGLSVSITPQSASNKVLVTATAVVQNSQGQYAVLGSLYRGATNLATGTAPAVMYYGRLGGATGSLVNTMNVQFLDSPATTNATTYQVYIAVESSGTAYFGATVGGAGSNIMIITAMEISA